MLEAGSLHLTCDMPGYSTRKWLDAKEGDTVLWEANGLNRDIDVNVSKQDADDCQLLAFIALVAPNHKPAINFACSRMFWNAALLASYLNPHSRHKLA